MFSKFSIPVVIGFAFGSPVCVCSIDLPLFHDGFISYFSHPAILFSVFFIVFHYCVWFRLEVTNCLGFILILHFFIFVCSLLYQLSFIPMGCVCWSWGEVCASHRIAPTALLYLCHPDIHTIGCLCFYLSFCSNG